MQKGDEATICGLFVNFFLFVIKLGAGLLSHSLAVLSDAFNSFTDIISSLVVYLAVRSSSRMADDGHPFGHHRAEPIAGLVIAIFAGILGFEVLRKAVMGLIMPETIHFGVYPMLALGVSMLLKSILTVYFKRVGIELNSPALLASSVDSRNDVLVSLTALLGFLGSFKGYHYLDSVAAFVIGLWIVFSGYKIGIENIDYLMGKAPGPEAIDSIKERALGVKGVLGVNDVKAHYVGNYIHVEVHICLDTTLSLYQAHEIGKMVQREIEALECVDKAFVHIDPVAVPS